MKKILTKDELNDFIGQQLNIINEQQKREDRSNNDNYFISGKLQILNYLSDFIKDYQ